MTIRLAANVLAIVGCASFAGVMLAIGLILGAYWRSLPPTEFLAWFAQNNLLVGRVIPMVAVPAFVGLFVSLWLDWSAAGARSLWLAALAALIALFAITAIYHLPTNALFASNGLPPEQVAGRLGTWIDLHTVRIALGFLAAICGVAAIVR